ncbi:MAG: cysteine desulfurase NifS [Verrucomicrobium sp.]|nr:cysteine desulfurase NifS [Verrucomicrobium sp.]
MTTPRAYLDHNATTPIAPEVFEAMVPFLTEQYGNPSSAYDFGKSAGAAVARAREQLASLLNCEPRELLFTSCGTESDNAAILSALRTTGKKHLVTTQVEHSAVHKLCEDLETRGYRVTWLPVAEDGTLDPSQVDEAIHDDTAVVSVMWANNETGVLFPVEEIAALCRTRGVLFHTDAVQTVGKLPIDLSGGQGPDFLALSGHKLHAPKGIGALYIRSGVRFVPFQIGGGQERERRGGTENVPYIVGLGRAAELSAENLLEEETRTRALRDKLEAALLRVPGAARNGHATLRLPNTASLRFEGVEAEAALLALNKRGICASAGSACTTGNLAPSHVLTAMGLSAADARGTLRFSLSHMTTDAEIDYALGAIPEAIAEVRSHLPATLQPK